MAATTDIGSMVIRLIGDISSYESALRQAVTTTQNAVNQISQAGSNLTNFITKPLMGFGTGSVKAFRSFDEALYNSASIIGATDAQLQKMRQTAMRISTELPVSAEKVAQSFWYLFSAGLNVERSISAIPVVAKFAAANMMSMEKATNYLVGAQTAMGLSSENVHANFAGMERTANLLTRANLLAQASAEDFAKSLTRQAGPSLRAVNKDMEEGLALLAVMARANIKAQLASGFVDRGLRLLSNTATKFEARWKSVGIEVFDSSHNMRHMADIMVDMEKAMLHLAPKSRILMMNFLRLDTRTQQAMLPLLGMSKQIRDFDTQLREAGNTINDVSQYQLKSFNNQVKLLQAHVTNASISIGEMLAPMLRMVNELLSAAAQWWNSLSQETRQSILMFLGAAAAIGPVLTVLGLIPTLLRLVIGSWLQGFGVMLMPVRALSFVLLGLYNIIAVTLFGAMTVLWTLIRVYLIATLYATILRVELLILALRLLVRGIIIVINPLNIVRAILFSLGLVIRLVTTSILLLQYAWNTIIPVLARVVVSLFLVFVNILNISGTAVVRAVVAIGSLTTSMWTFITTSVTLRGVLTALIIAGFMPFAAVGLAAAGGVALLAGALRGAYLGLIGLNFGLRGVSQALAWLRPQIVWLARGFLFAVNPVRILGLALRGLRMILATALGPWGLLIMGITVALSFFITKMDEAGSAGGALTRLWEGAKQAFSDFIDWIRPAAYQITNIFNALWENVVFVATTVWSTIQPVIAGFRDWFIGLWGSAGSDFELTWENVRLAILSTLIAVEFALRNSQQMFEFLGVYAQLSAVAIGNLFTYWFTEAIPATFEYMSTNWRSILEDMWNFSKAVFNNIIDNMANAWNRIRSGDFNLSGIWQDLSTDLLRGFERTMPEFHLPERTIGPLEAELADRVRDLGGTISDEFADFRDRRLEELLAPHVPAGAGGFWSHFMGEIENVPPKIDDHFDQLQTSVKSGIGKFDAALSGSAESISRLQEYNDRLGDTFSGKGRLGGPGGAGAGGTGTRGGINIVNPGGGGTTGAGGAVDQQTQYLREIRDLLGARAGTTIEVRPIT